jgi:hypothetical protein
LRVVTPKEGLDPDAGWVLVACEIFHIFYLISESFSINNRGLIFLYKSLRSLSVIYNKKKALQINLASASSLRDKYLNRK